MKASTTAPVIRAVEVAVSVEQAFSVFVERIGEWWPFALHSIFGTEAEGATVEPFVGGRVYEIASDGRQAEWGRVVRFEPPHLLVMEWKPNSRATPPTRVEIAFEPVGDLTRVRLTHTGWELLGDDGEKARAGYDEGWVPTLAAYVARLSSKTS